MLLGFIAPTPPIGLPIGNGIVPFARGAAALAPRLVGPLAPAVPVLGRTGAGLAILGAFAVGWQVGTWLWGLLNRTAPKQPADQEGWEWVAPQEGPIVVTWQVIRKGARLTRCSTGVSVKNPDADYYDSVSTFGGIVSVGKTKATETYSCTGTTTGGVINIGFSVLRSWGGVMAERYESQYDGNRANEDFYTESPNINEIKIVGIRLAGVDQELPTEPDPDFEPVRRPDPLPLPQPPPLPLPQPETPPLLPEAPPETLPLPQPEEPPRTPSAPPIAPPVAPPVTQPRPPVRPAQPSRPPRPTLPDGGVAPDPVPPPTTRPPGVETIPGGEVGGPGQKPRADLEGIAAEVGRIEGKVIQVLENQQKAGGGDELLKLLEELKKLLEGPFPAGSYELFPVCETDANGQPRPPMVAEWEAGTGANELLGRKLDALAELIQFHKELRQPVCNRAPIGEEVTVNFREDPETATGATLLRKVLRYRDRTGASVASHAAHWEGFEWDAGPVIVSAIGPWGEVQVWASSRGEGQRVIRHALSAGGWNPDSDPNAEWLDTVAPSGRAGRSGRMLVAVDLQGLRVTKRRGSSGPPEQVLPE